MKLKLLLMSFILSAVTVCAYAQTEQAVIDDENILFYENFEYYFSGIPSGWSIEEARSVQPFLSKDAQGRCAKLISTETLYDAALKKFFANPIESGKVFVHMKIKTPDVIFKRSMFAFRDTANRECTAVMFDSDGYIKTSSGINLAMYQTNRWYDFLVRFDMDNKTHSIWLDGECVIENLTMANTQMSNIYYFKFAQLERQNAYCYVDDIYAYKGEEIIPEEALKAAYFFSYSDIDDSWARGEIEDFAALHITSKTDDGKFHPEGNVLKGEFTQWFRGSMGISEANYVGMCTDIKATDEIAGSIAALVNSGTSGPYTGEWKPESEVTLGDALEMIIEGYKYQKNLLPGEPEKKFASWQEKGSWARDYEAQADAIKLCENVKGLNQARGNLDKILTRAQTVKLLANYQQIINQ